MVRNELPDITQRTAQVDRAPGPLRLLGTWGGGGGGGIPPSSGVRITPPPVEYITPDMQMRQPSARLAQLTHFWLVGFWV